MTTFEFFVLLSLGIIVLSVMFGGYVMCRAFDKIIHNQDAIQQDIQRIEVNTHHASSVFQDHIAPDVEIISNNFLHLIAQADGVAKELRFVREGNNHILSRLHPEYQIMNDCSVCSKSFGCPDFSYTRSFCIDKYDAKLSNKATDNNKED